MKRIRIIYVTTCEHVWLRLTETFYNFNIPDIVCGEMQLMFYLLKFNCHFKCSTLSL